MSVAPFTVEMIFVFLLTLCLLHQYGNWRKQHWLVTIAVFVAWYFSFLIVFILPLDVSATFYRKCLLAANTYKTVTPSLSLSSNNSSENSSDDKEASINDCEKPWSFLPVQVLPDLWRVVYWSSQILSWVILPIMQSYSYAGDFTVRGKIKTALFENALWYGSYLVIFGILLIYVILKPELPLDGTYLKIIGITASNTWGLLLLVFLMGYGLVEVPRVTWNSARVEYQMAHAYFKISKLSVEKEDAEEQLTEVLEEVNHASVTLRYRHPLRKYLEIIMKKCPESSRSSFDRGTDDYVDYDDYLKETGSRVTETYTEKSLAKLHKCVIIVTHTSKRTQCQWNMTLDKVFELEDLLRNTGSSDRHYKSSLRPSSSGVKSVLEWYWRVWMYPWLLRITAVLLFLLSITLVWSEVTFFNVQPVLSIYAQMIRAASDGYYYFYVEEAVYGQAVNLSSLQRLLCRLTYALCLNFLAVIHLDGHVTGAVEQVETSFTKFMGHMDVLSFISKGVNVYYPMCVVLVCLATYFSLGTRCLNCLGFQTFIIEDDLSAEYVSEGKDISRRERRKREMLGEDGRRKESWAERAESTKKKLSARRADRGGHLVSDKEMHATSSTNLASDGQFAKYSRFDSDSDRVELLSAADYDPNGPSNYSATSSGYGRSSSSRAPRNIFDDL
ncbi:G-protein coupled receptor-associated protein LMBRD2 [Acropora cervicornis]|uniref:G-protein coupled receptor-associated protein LMBRD2 n=1 Tax=Acropora cervicornis TaxID=6130 RepID=A0AAD9Q4N0_ACRCE|nr:G-protein coupled receptor-associated protein LMBRD2 [Acropora cervicornis]